MSCSSCNMASIFFVCPLSFPFPLAFLFLQFCLISHFVFVSLSDSHYQTLTLPLCRWPDCFRQVPFLFFSFFQSDVLLSQAVTNDEQRLALIFCGIVCNLKVTIDLPLHSQRLRSRASLHTLGFAFLFSAPLLCASFFRWCMCCSAHTELFPLFFDYFFSSTCIV